MKFFYFFLPGTGCAQDNLGVKKVSALLKNPPKCPIMCFAHKKNLPHFQNQWYMNSSNVNIWQDDKVDVITWLDDKLLLWYNLMITFTVFCYYVKDDNIDFVLWLGYNIRFFFGWDDHNLTKSFSCIFLLILFRLILLYLIVLFCKQKILLLFHSFSFKTKW